MRRSHLDKINFNYLIKPFSFKRRKRLKEFLIKKINRSGSKIAGINFIFCTDAYLLEINKRFLQHNTYTDIITFKLSSEGKPLLSDIYISIDRVRENATLYKTTFQSELHRVIFHGILHLIGFNDKDVEQAAQMRVQETNWLSDYFVSREIK